MVSHANGRSPPTSKSLQALLHHYDLGAQQHRAIADCKDLMRLCEALMEDFELSADQLLGLGRCNWPGLM